VIPDEESQKESRFKKSPDYRKTECVLTGVHDNTQQILPSIFSLI
jgi:hypothetical protein